MRSNLHTTRSTPRGRQRGQALAEFTIAAAFVLIPLFLMIPLLGKFMDMKATTIQAARYAAWERTAWYGNADWAAGQKSDAQIQSEVQQRFFADSATTPLRSTDQTLTGAVPARPRWYDHTGAPMLSAYSADAGNGTQTPGMTNVVLSDVHKFVEVIDSVLGTKFKLDMKSLYTSTVSLDAANTPAIRLATGADKSGFTAPNFVMTQVLVTNGWSANGPDFVKKQTEGLAVLSLAQRSPVKEVLHIVQSVLGTFVEELKPSSLKLGGELLPDLVPRDRLTASTAPAPSPGKTAEQRRKEEADKQNALAKALTDRVKAKVDALHDAIGTTQNSINTCNAAKQEEFHANFEDCRSGKLLCTWHSDGRWTCGGLTTPRSNFSCTPKVKPGTSWTPIADASVACHAGLDAQIAALQAKLADSDLQLAITKSDDQLAKNPDLVNDTVFMKNRNEAKAAIAAFQAQIDDLQRQIIDLRKPKNAL
jgi:hypothetical protein